jgi:predicted metal-dependent hydrolase
MKQVDIDSFVRSKEKWIQRKATELETHPATQHARPVHLDDDATCEI